MKNKQYSGESDEDRLLVSRVEDAVKAVARARSPKFIGFLDAHQRAAAERVIKASHEDINHAYWGGFENAERVYLGLFDGEPDNGAFPIGALRLTWKFGNLTHRDFLGALLSLGIKREKLGDITVGDNECAVVVDKAIMGFIDQNLTKVGGSGVSVAAADLNTITKQQEYGDLGDTIASPRLDCIIAALVNMSRGKAEMLIQSGAVSVDFETAADTAAKVREGATVSIRGHGRFIVDSIGPETKKGRLKFAARKYL